MNKRKMLFFIIILLIVIIIIISMTLIVLRKGTKPISVQDPSYTDDELQAQEISQVKDNNLFYTIESCVQKYQTYLNLNYEIQIDELNMPSIAAVYGISTEEQKIEALINLLDKEYIKENKINSKNIFNYLPKSFDDLEVKAVKINKLKSSSIYVDSYAAMVELINPKGKENKIFIVKLDKKNSTFCLNPIEKFKNNDLEKIQITNETKQIEKNNNN